MATNISIKGLPKGAVLAALYNASKPQGMGFIHYDPTPMTAEQGQKLFDECGGFFDYLKGRVMKIDISGDEVGTWGYDRDNGQGAAEKAIKTLQNTGNENHGTIRETHQANTMASAVAVSGRLGERTTFQPTAPGVSKMNLGFDDVREYIEPKVRAIVGDRNG